jgi:hypothetical protein
MFIIVKYASDWWPEGAPLSASVFDSHSARKVGVTKRTYETPQEAQPDLEKLRSYNESVEYGVVPVVAEEEEDDV